MVAMASGWINECVGCMEVVSPSGLGELAIGLLVTTVVLAPGSCSIGSCEAEAADRILAGSPYQPLIRPSWATPPREAEAVRRTGRGNAILSGRIDDDSGARADSPL